MASDTKPPPLDLHTLCSGYIDNRAKLTKQLIQDVSNSEESKINRNMYLITSLGGLRTQTLTRGSVFPAAGTHEDLVMLNKEKKIFSVQELYIRKHTLENKVKLHI